MLGLAIWLLSQFMSGQVPDDVTGADCGGVDLVASREYGPTVWNDATVDLTESQTFEIPAVLPVTSGNAGNKSASLSFSDAGGALVVCYYDGGAPNAHPVAPANVALGQAYVFDNCDDGSVAGELATADHFVLHVQNGDSWRGTTEVSVFLEDAACIFANGPCGDGTWGGITWLGQTAHVRADGDDANDGSESAPVASIDRALEITRSWGSGVGKKAIAVGPGTFDTAAALDQVEDADTWIMGCSAAETILNGSDPASPVVDLAAPGQAGVKAVSIQGGSVGLRMRDGVDGFADDLAILATGASGIRVDGASTVAWVSDSEVTDPVGTAGCAWGAAVDDGTLVSVGTAIRGAQEVGVGAMDANVVLADFEVEGTWQNGLGMLGRGVHAQGGWTALVEGHIVDNFDAGIFILEPIGAIVVNIEIDFTSAGITASGGATGDGVVISGTSQTRVLIIDNIFFQNDRGGVVVDGSEVNVKGNSASGNGSFDLVKQGGANVTGPQAGSAVDMTATPLALEKTPLTCN